MQKVRKTQTASLRRTERRQKQDARCRQIVGNESEVVTRRMAEVACEQVANIGSKRGSLTLFHAWDRRVEGFREHIAINCSLKRVSGRDTASGWAGLRQRRRGVVCCWWHDAGRTASAKNDATGRIVGLHFGTVLADILGRLWR